MATATATIEASKSLIQSESHVQRTYTETSHNQVSEQRQLKKKKSRRHKDDGNISVSKSSEKLHKKMKSTEMEANPECSKCSKPVYIMERVKAEKRTWHKECFRCVRCNKQLTVETYESEHTTLYCKQHFKQLFEPKPVDEERDQTDATPKKHQMIICESNPVELPPDVVRASDKPDLGLEELSQLDVKSRFEVFENKGKHVVEPPPPEPKTPREKSQTLLSKLAKFKAKGMDVGVSDEYLTGVPVEDSGSEQEDGEDEDSVLKKSYKMANSTSREQPVSFCNMSEIVGKFETGLDQESERHRTRKQEIQNIRTRLFMGKQAKIKEMYEQSVAQSEQSITSAEKIARELDLDVDKARAIKERFESGQVFNDENTPPRNKEIDDTQLFNEGIGKKSRSIFLELDANAKNCGPLSPPPHEPPRRKEIPFIPVDVVRAGDKVDDVHIETSDISERFKFFETYKPEHTKKEFRITPPRQAPRERSPSPEIYHEPSVVRHGGGGGVGGAADGAELAAERHTASRMISVFRNLEEQQHDNYANGPKPLKRFTPPPEGPRARADSRSGSESGSGSEYTSEDDSDDVNRPLTYDPELRETQQLARTKSFREKFENWREHEPPPRSPSGVLIERPHAEDEDGDSQLETAKSLRAKFESMTVQQNNVTKTFATKVNRFV